MAYQAQDHEGAWQRKADEWAQKLVQLDSHNGLLNFRITKTSTLDLTACPDHTTAKLFAGNQVRLSELFTEDEAYRDACTRVRNLVRRIRGFSEEQGVDVGRIVYGRVVSGKSRRGGARPPVALRAPLLLYQVVIQARTAAENEFTVRIEREPELNPVLRLCLEREYGLQLDDGRLDDLLSEAESSVAPDEFAAQLFGVIADACGDQGVELELQPMAAVGVCNYAKLPMVDDLKSATHLLEHNEVIAALAGLPSAGADIHSQHPFRPVPPDDVPPNQEYLVLDADSSQYRAIATVLADRHVVIDGPPGTGKSQTIANLIAAGAAAGRKILFVAEKRAAIEAVTDRLTDIGLDSLVLDLHHSRNSSRAVAGQLSESFEKLSAIPVIDGDALDRQLFDTRRRLNEYVAALHDKREPWDLSAYNVRETLMRGPAGIETAVRLRGLARFTPDARRRIEKDLHSFVDNGGLRLVRRESPWWRARVVTQEDARTLRDHLDDMTTRTLRDSQANMRTLVGDVGLPEPRDLPGWKHTLELLGKMADSAATLGPDIFRGPLDEYRVATASWADRRTMQPKVGWFQRSKLRKELRRNPAGITRRPQLHTEIIKVLDELGEWRRMSGGVEGPGRIGDLQAVWDKYTGLRDQLAAIAMSSGVALDEQPLDDIDRELHALAADRDMLPFLPDLNAQLQRLREFGLDGLLAEIAERDFGPEQAVAVFDHALMRSLDDEFVLISGPLREFRADSHGQILDRFRRADRDHRDLAVKRVLRRVAERAQQVGAEYPAESNMLRTEAKKKRGHRRLRKLVSEAQHAMLAVRPCWAMSPLEVSRLLPAEQLFDLVVFDEASQVQPHDAITSIMRGKKLVIAGDDKQLPPTRFFERSELDGEGSDDDNELGDFESILSRLQPLVPDRCRLLWHYRSRDERLIRFANEEVYGRELVTFPGAHTADPVRLEVVDGRVKPGESGSADAEVTRVVELIFDHAENRPCESLGVITLGEKHQNKLDIALRQARAQRPDLNEFFAEDRGPTKRFFLKNIETVQGDERDAIILSIGIAKNAAGGVQGRGFGVLNQEGTERRINVAVTRAKRRMTVVSSFSPGALAAREAGKPMTGTELLRRYLDAAQHGGATEYVGRRTDIALNGFEQAICDALNAQDIEVVPQWGVSDYRIDFALPHPDEPGRMVLAVEADGDSYHRSPGARDRDRLRQQQLERLGWRFHRVWASAWFTDPDGEVARIVAAWKDAVADAASTDTVAREPERSMPTFFPGVEPTIPRPDVHPGLPIDRYQHAELMAMFLWRMSDGLLLDPEERIRQVRMDLGFKRRGRRIDERLQNMYDEALRVHENKGL